MNALLLIDADNAFSKLTSANKAAEFAKDASSLLEPIAGRFTGATVSTVFALNTVSAIEYELTFEALRACGDRLRACLQGSRGHTEVALTLPMPQTADVLLGRLALERPDEASPPDYELAVLFSQDAGLARTLGAQRAWHGWIRIANNWCGQAWANHGGRPALRRPPATARSSKGPVPNLTCFTLEVASDGLAGWASERRVDLPPACSLVDLARRAEREPWILSQLSATQRSVRGVSRLHAVQTEDAPMLGPVSAKDGLEVRGQAARPVSGSDAALASVGIGAVRFRQPGATIRAYLPVPVLRGLQGACPIAMGGVPTARVLQQLQGNAVIEPLVQVELSGRGTDLVAKVVHNCLQQPRAWWIGRETKCSSEARIEAAGYLAAGAVKVSARPVRSVTRDYQLVLGGPTLGEVQLKIATEIVKGTLGTGTLHGSPDDELSCAILAPNAPLSAGSVVTARPIQALPAVGVLRYLPPGLWNLPLMVVI